MILFGGRYLSGRREGKRDGNTNSKTIQDWPLAFQLVASWRFPVGHQTSQSDCRIGVVRLGLFDVYANALPCLKPNSNTALCGNAKAAFN